MADGKCGGWTAAPIIVSNSLIMRRTRHPGEADATAEDAPSDGSRADLRASRRRRRSAAASTRRSRSAAAPRARSAQRQRPVAAARRQPARRGESPSPVSKARPRRRWRVSARSSSAPPRAATSPPPARRKPPISCAAISPPMRAPRERRASPMCSTCSITTARRARRLTDEIAVRGAGDPWSAARRQGARRARRARSRRSRRLSLRHARGDRRGRRRIGRDHRHGDPRRAGARAERRQAAGIRRGEVKPSSGRLSGPSFKAVFRGRLAAH